MDEEVLQFKYSHMVAEGTSRGSVGTEGVDKKIIIRGCSADG